MSTRTWLVLLLSLAAPTPAFVRGNDTRDPYRVRVVLQVERHRLLTPVFRERMQRELGDGLQAALGALARVEVEDAHPLLPAIRKDGLRKSIDAYRERSPYHTHFVRVEFTGTHYEVEARMHDGMTGLPSPVVRQGRTDDRDFVSRLATFLIERDLGLLGTVVSEPELDPKERDRPRQVRLQLKGGDLGVDMGKWIKPGEIFQLVQVDASGAGRLVESAYLRVVKPPEGSTCVCGVISRYDLRRTTGLRAVLLGTRVGSIRLRLLQENRGSVRPLLSASLQFRKHSFEGEAIAFQTVTSGREIDTARVGKQGVFDRMAFVSVFSGEDRRAVVPIPVIDDSTQDIVIPATNEEGDLFTFRFRSLLRNAREAYLVQANLINEINKLTAKPDQRVQALARVRQTLTRLEEDHVKLSGERDEMKKEIARKPAALQPRPEDVRAIDEWLKRVKAGEVSLLAHVAEFEKIEKEENDPETKEWKVQKERADLLLKAGDIGGAITILEKAPMKHQTPEWQQYLAGLKKQFEPRDAEHAKARRFIFDVWPTLDTEGLQRELAQAKSALAVCMKVEDVYGPAKMQTALQEHVKRMQKEADVLRPNVNIDDEKPAKRIQDLAPQLRAIDDQITAHLEKFRKAGP